MEGWRERRKRTHILHLAHGKGQVAGKGEHKLVHCAGEKCQLGHLAQVGGIDGGLPAPSNPPIQQE